MSKKDDNADELSQIEEEIERLSAEIQMSAQRKGDYDAFLAYCGLKEQQTLVYHCHACPSVAKIQRRAVESGLIESPILPSGRAHERSRMLRNDTGTRQSWQGLDSSTSWCTTGSGSRCDARRGGSDRLADLDGRAGRFRCLARLGLVLEKTDWRTAIIRQCL
jgi:superfamily II DNA helicase RecQ